MFYSSSLHVIWQNEVGRSSFLYRDCDRDPALSMMFHLGLTLPIPSK